MTFKPNLAATIDPMKEPDVLFRLQFPLLLSPKYDGIRCLPRDQVLVSRSYTPLPNPFLQAKFSQLELNFLDTEAIWGDPCDGDDVYNRTQSLVMTGHKKATHANDTTLFVFDWTEESRAHLPFPERLEIARRQVLKINRPDVVFVEHTLVWTLDQFIAYEENALSQGFEGIMARNLTGTYKHGRSTFKEHSLMKYKRFEDFEAPIVGFVEATKNTNAKLKDNFGHAKRSSCKSGMVPSNTLGTFLVEWEGGVHEIPPGTFKHPRRKEIWDNKEKYLGQLLKVRHFPYGAKEGLRLPRAVGFRDRSDL